MKTRMLIFSVALIFMVSCANEISITSSDVPEVVMSSFTSKYPMARETEWEIEKQDGKLYYEAEFKIEGKRMEAYFRPDGTFSKAE